MSDATLRFVIFITLLLVLIGLEAVLPRKKRVLPRLMRWFPNIAIAFLNGAILKLLLPLGAVGAATLAQNGGFGLFNIVPMPQWVAIIIAFMLLDLAIYAQHRLFHVVPWLWRLHKMHHADTEIDVTTGIRFHPLEALLSMVIKIGVVMLLGAPIIAVIIFEIVLNAGAMFSHSNLKLPLSLEKVLRLFIVTPDMHRVHHSVLREEHDSNYGFSFAFWDRLFGTYQAQPVAGHEEMRIGLNEFRGEEEARLDKILTQPFRGK